MFKDDKIVFLSATEYRLLLQFAHNIGVVLTSEQLLTDVWGTEYHDDKEILVGEHLSPAPEIRK